MKITFIALITLATTTVYAETIRDMSRKSVTRLELVVNNFNNMLTLKHDELMGKAAEDEKDNPVKTSAMRFYLSKDNNLIASFSHKAPVGLVTKAKCNEVLKENIDGVKNKNSTGDNPNIAGILNLMSIYDVPHTEWQTFVNNASVYTYISANENAELSVSCSGV